MNGNTIAYLQHYQNLSLTPIPPCIPKPEEERLQREISCPYNLEVSKRINSGIVFGGQVKLTER
jgi:hypothetical protein